MHRLSVVDALSWFLVFILGSFCLCAVVHTTSITWSEYWRLSARIDSIVKQQNIYPNLATDCPHNHDYISNDLDMAAMGALAPAMWAGLRRNFGSVAIQNIYSRAAENIVFEMLVPSNWVVRAIMACIAAIGVIAIVIIIILSVAAVMINHDRSNAFKDVKLGKQQATAGISASAIRKLASL